MDYTITFYAGEDVPGDWLDKHKEELSAGVIEMILGDNRCHGGGAKLFRLEPMHDQEIGTYFLVGLLGNSGDLALNICRTKAAAKTAFEGMLQVLQELDSPIPASSLH